MFSCGTEFSSRDIFLPGPAHFRLGQPPIVQVQAKPSRIPPSRSGALPFVNFSYRFGLARKFSEKMHSGGEPQIGLPDLERRSQAGICNFDRPAGAMRDLFSEWRP